jgi:molybdenum cofactor guanylyltransferase
MKPACVVLAGGEGRRMGGSKPLRRLGTTTLILHAIELARRYGEPVAVAVRDPSQVGEVGARLLVDNPDMAGPLAGLASALAYAARSGRARVLTIACDMPRLPSDLATRLGAALDASPHAMVALASSQGRLHPVCALWKAEALEQIAPYAAAGWNSLKGFAQACGAAVVKWDAGEADPFANANTPDELAALQPVESGFAF